MRAPRDAGRLGVGVIGCGNISESYLARAALFAGIEMRAVADLDASRAEARAAAKTGMARDKRVIATAPRTGETIPVETPTTAHALLDFASGAQITFSASWDVLHHGHRNVELYGTEGTLLPQDPNFFGGTTEIVGPDQDVRSFEAADHPLSVVNRTTRDGRPRADYRRVGLADMVRAIQTGGPHRCALEMALHVTEVLEAILRLGEEGRLIEMTTTCARPAPFDAAAARRLMPEGAVAA